MWADGKSLRSTGAADSRALEAEDPRQGADGASARPVLRGTQCWRWGLREHSFLDAKPSPNDVPKALVEHLESIHSQMCAAWDEMYPHNPVTSQDDDDD
jgi:hypothetical protein